MPCWTVYVLENEEGRHYIGMTAEIGERLRSHNSGGNRWTRKKGPWRVVYSEEYADKMSAISREKQIKSYKGGRAFKKLLSK